MPMLAAVSCCYGECPIQGSLFCSSRISPQQLGIINKRDTGVTITGRVKPIIQSPGANPVAVSAFITIPWMMVNTMPISQQAMGLAATLDIVVGRDVVLVFSVTVLKDGVSHPHS